MTTCTHGDWIEVKELVAGTADGVRRFRVCRKCLCIQEERRRG